MAEYAAIVTTPYSTLDVSHTTPHIKGLNLQQKNNDLITALPFDSMHKTPYHITLSTLNDTKRNLILR